MKSMCQPAIYLLIVCTFFCNNTSAQVAPTSMFIPPMQLPFHLAGSFAEPRENHFHSGIDIKTNGVEGQPVFAIADGYIARIRVSPYGYGKAIYITHTNGYTSVYGHLSIFYSNIEKYMQQIQYAQQKSEMDITLDVNKLPVKQGDTIAFSGNTGGSSAPHLHFEIRDTKTEHALNPLAFYPTTAYADTTPPQFTAVKINFKKSDSSTILPLMYQNEYVTTATPIYVEENETISFSLQGYDKQDAHSGKNGIQHIDVFMKDSLCFSYQLSAVDFDKTRYCNAFVDYDEMKNNNGYFYNCFQLEGNRLPIYLPKKNGFLKVHRSDFYVDIFAYDYNKNKTTIRLFIQTIPKNKSSFELPKHPKTLTVSSNTKAFTVASHPVRMQFPTACFYEKTTLTYQHIKNNDSNIVSDVWYIANPKKYVPLHLSATISIATSNLKNNLKYVIVRRSKDGTETALSTKRTATTLSAETKELGSFFVRCDTLPPDIILESLPSSKDSVKQTTIVATIKDAIAGIATYDGYIDEQWVNFYYDAKNDKLIYTLDAYCTKGIHQLKIRATDKVGNIQTIQQNFRYE